MSIRRPDILWRSCGFPRFKMKTPAEWQPPGEVGDRADAARPWFELSSEGKVPKGNQSSSGSSPFKMTYSRHRLRASAWDHPSLLMPTATAIYFILQFVHVPNVRRCGCVSGALSQSSIREEAAKPE